jgi:hypothetical protein
LRKGRVVESSQRSGTLGLAANATASSQIDVLGRVRSRPGIRVHRSRTLHADERDECDGIPVTSVARTITDVADRLGETGLRRIIDRADRLQLLDLAALERRRPGKALGRVLRDYQPLPFTRSELERVFIDLCREHAIPPPTMNTTAAELEVDALWPEHRLVVELDGYEFHRSRAAFERDRERDVQLQLAGYRVLRYTARQIARNPRAIAEQLRRVLS